NRWRPGAIGRPERPNRTRSNHAERLGPRAQRFQDGADNEVVNRLGQPQDDWRSRDQLRRAEDSTRPAERTGNLRDRISARIDASFALRAASNEDRGRAWSNWSKANFGR